MEDNQKYLKQIQEYFLDRAIKNNFDVRSFWGSEESQYKRFSIMSQIGDLNNKVILDYGCGKADLYKYLVEQKVSLKKYIGIDAVPEFVDLAQKKLSNTGIS